MATPHNDCDQSHLNFMYFPIFNNRTFRDSEGPKTADLRNYLEELYRLPPPIGLKLKKSSKLAALIEKRLRESKFKRISKNLALVDRAEKSKADHFPFYFLEIGAFKVASMCAADLMAKCYYGKRRLVWEILQNGLKNKIEIPWQTILSMRTRVRKNGIGILDLELKESPSFFHEIDPKPRQHTIWIPTSDFTGGQASIYRRHYLEFPPGIVVHLQKLLSDGLSRKRFPSLASPYFNPKIPYGNNEHQPRSLQPIPQSQQFPTLPYGNELPSLPFNQSPSPTSEERFPDLTQLCSQPIPSSPQLPMFPYSNIVPSSLAFDQSSSLISDLAEDCFQDPTLALCNHELGGFVDSSTSHLMLDDPYGAELHDTRSNYNNVSDNNEMLLSNWSSDIDTTCENKHVDNLWIPCANTISSGTQDDLYIPKSESELWAVNAASNAHLCIPQSESELWDVNAASNAHLSIPQSESELLAMNAASNAHLCIPQSESESQAVNTSNNANANELSLLLTSQQSCYFSTFQQEIWNNLISINGTVDPSMDVESRGCNNNNKIGRHG